ncbi:type II toxin-antitoxin system RelE/ParE family toxin [Streptomyces sp. DSM 41982]|uniref:Type II toxin-antitoxin system RelE/ParE family toxin n=1 Tax=Streptomyces evansiae TaxID=3075535 RepID=A0ABD5EBE4_9ACTN|nr:MULTISPECIES: type II toxin-antitoxin system RelE/ParE family toxin [unclassified Streptomyces]MDT0418087.1 type II toxin-antitoxin system RelE/ParE family toxin [Streptomyces sp. DSM 41982]SCE27282.1 Putative component of the toxin-antitoxin plasmid stabilization module [Streptomyces sp. SolWspMP-sol7th]
MANRWVLYRSSVGAEVVQKEIDKCRLKRDEKIRLGAIMKRAAEGNLLPKDRKPLGEGLWELRLSCGERIFRLFYSEVKGAGPVLLGLRFVNKKSTQGIKTDPGDIETARKRLAEWQSRTSGDDTAP